MTKNLEKAKECLNEKTVFAIVDDNQTITSDKSGISFLASIKKNDIDASSCAAADKIVGKAAALLFVRLDIKHIFAETISKTAIKVLDSYGADYSYSVVADTINNRTGDGLCPMEMTVQNIDDPEQAHIALLQTLERLRNKTKVQ